MDPVRVKRARIAKLVQLGQRVGYALFGLAIVLFVVGFVGDFSDGIATAIAVCLAAGSVILAPAIIFGYAVRAAEKDDRQHGR